MKDIFEIERVSSANGKINMKNYRAYQEAVHLLTELQAKGKLKFEADKLTDNYELHCIYVTWFPNERGTVDLDENETELVREILKNKALLFNMVDPDVWQISCQVFVDLSAE